MGSCAPIVHRGQMLRDNVYFGSTSPTAHDESHEAVLHDPVRPQTSADRHDMPHECPGEADHETGTWCGIYHANTMYVRQYLMKLSTLIKRMHYEMVLITLVEITSWGVNGPYSVRVVASISNFSTCEHTTTTCRPRSSRCLLSFAERRAEAREFLNSSTSMSTRASSTNQTGGTPQPERTEDAALVLAGTYSVTSVAEKDVCICAGSTVPARARDVESTAAQQRRRRQQQQPHPELQQPQLQQPQPQQTQPRQKQQHHKQQHPKQQPQQQAATQEQRQQAHLQSPAPSQHSPPDWHPIRAEAQQTYYCF